MGSAHPPPMKGNEQSVASTEIVRNFSVWQNRSADRPVYILHHGRPRSVLLSLVPYSELAAGLGSQDEREERLRTHIDILLARRSEEHTPELQSPMRHSSAAIYVKKNKH